MSYLKAFHTRRPPAEKRLSSGGARGRATAQGTKGGGTKGGSKVDWKLSSDGPSFGGHSLEILPRAPKTLDPLLLLSPKLLCVRGKTHML